MKTILHILRKEFWQLKRDPQILRLVLIAPLLQLILFGYAINLDVQNVPMVICDQDHSATSRQFIQQFQNSGYFTIIGYVNKAEDEDPFLEKSTASIAMNIPPQFGDKVLSGKPAELQVIADGSESSAASVGLSYTAMVVGRFSQSILLRSFSRAGIGSLKPVGVEPEVRVWYNPALKSRNYLIPGILAALLMSTTMMLTSLAIVKEKEIGTMDQIIVTPIKPYQLIIGKLTPFILIGMVNVVLALAGIALWFQIPIHGNVFELIAFCGVFLLTTLGLGLFVSTISRTQQQAMMTSMFFVMMPMNFLSGFVFPIENMPKAIQYFTYIFPLRYFYEIIRGVFLRGVGLSILWPNVLAMALFGIGILALSTLRFRKTLG